MCRINGIIQKSVDENILTKMRDVLSHGGPDDAGLYINCTNNVGLGQRRLSIIDLSPRGHQPMIWGDYVVVYNGEIYNFLEISKQLITEGYSFTSSSDTEVIIKAFDFWGYDAVHKFRGMFAFALWNTKTQKLLICRDRVGVKPLYWYNYGGIFMFASELKSFHEHPDFNKTINQDAVNLFLQTGYIRSPHSIYKYAHKLEPGSFLEIDVQLNIKIWKYWEIRDIYQNTTVSKLPESTLIQDCENILTESFKLRMVSDVPVGMFLSGGVDSSLVTALLQKESLTPLKTFTIGFEDKQYNEADHAKKIANHLGTEHRELYCNEHHFEEIIEKLPTFYDEPFGDSSAIPTYLVSQLAKEHVTVSLSADGGDEIFTGYNRYLFAETLHNKFKYIPSVLKNVIESVLHGMDLKQIQTILKVLPIPQYYKKNVDSRIPKLIETLKAQTPLDFLYSSTIFLTKDNLKKIHRHETSEKIFNAQLNIKDNQKFGSYGVVDIESYLEGDILTKIDRATMQVALEGREPFLDHKIIEFALSLPDNMKLRNGKTKWILREILYKYVPKELIERPKMGFGIPLDKWLSSLLKEDLIIMCEDDRFMDSFMLNKNYVKSLVNSYLLGGGFSPYLIWYLYCLYKWHLRWN